MTETTTGTLAGLTLPACGPLARDHARPPERRTEHYLDRYDSHTLFYDCTYDNRRGSYLITAPLFLNLWDAFRRALRQDGRPLRRLSRHRMEKCEQIEVSAPLGTITIDLPGVSGPLPVRDTLSARFAGLNCIVTLNRNNNLQWLRDWADYHVRAHGLQGLLLFDNGSDLYDVETLAKGLGEVRGLEKVVVLSAPYPYGPTDSGKGLERPTFLQTALLNLARREALREARAVLNADIDELVWARGGESVFDAAASRPNSMVKIHGRWAYPAPDTPLPAPHRAHTHRGLPEKHCNQKWASAPSGMLSRFGWSPHHVGGRLVRLVSKDPRFELIHCRGTSTGWKSKRFDLPTRIFDPELARFMEHWFGTTATP